MLWRTIKNFLLTFPWLLTWSPREPHKICVSPTCFNSRFWLRTTKNIYIYSAGLGLTVIAVEYGSFWKEAITGSMTALKLQKFFKRNLVLKLSCSAQSPSLLENRGLLEPSPFPRVRPSVLKINYLRKQICFNVCNVTDSQELYYQRVLWIWYMYWKALSTPFSPPPTLSQND